MKRILVPCDFSATAKEAYAFALQLAGKMNAEIFVLNAIDLPFSYESTYTGGQYFNEKELLKQLQDETVKSFESLKSQIGQNGRVYLSAIQGPVSQVIQTFIQNEIIDLVVMGTNGASGMRELLVGSNTEKVVRNSPVPVIAIRVSTSLSAITDIVVPTDAMENHPRFNDALKSLQSLLMARIHFLLVSTEYPLRESNVLLENLTVYVRNGGFENFTVNLHRDDGKEAGIITFAKEINAGMIAMATHGRKGLNHLLFGSLAEDIVNHVNCPVWTFSIRNENEQNNEN
ncbi:MAG TPA: universal stress protein [Cyclobacteriaceae bacterium]|nr:universal stress protein [Cyclobacteriaceae bacterium]